MAFEGKVALVTGAGRGLGRAYALLLAKLGARVVVNNRTAAKADEVVAEITAAGGRAVADHHNVYPDGAKAVDTAIREYGRIDIVINNAGQLRDRTFGKVSWEEWHDVVDTHLHGTFLVTRAAWPHMVKQKYGRVVMVSSNSAVLGNVGQAAYSAAKGAVISLTRTLAQEGARHGIVVNAAATAGLTRMTERFGTHTGFLPEHTALGVVALCHNGMPESGQLYRVQGTRLFKLRWEAGEGVTYDSLKEDPAALEGVLLRKWSAVNDFSSAWHPEGRKPAPPVRPSSRL
eukprot:TRINITY_DN36528_c0_g1_i1.p1 TRINITY_DN36528_c0_g1~~TRINITY_DN36528_c0_g1_i1.p1  ORF type:complete len:288 (+),score=74.26 TRINITY_DN36528_c0_g1_i1:48-911(+)